MTKLFQFTVLCILQLYSFCSNVPILHAFHLCPLDQSLSLLRFKDKLHIDTFKTYCKTEDGFYMDEYLSFFCDRYNNQIIESMISSWNSSTDCCSWEGVTCDEFTGNVIKLDLSASRLTGVIDSNSSLFELSHLKRLNLANNYLHGSKISPEFRRFTHLSHLNLAETEFQGEVTSEISQLNELVSLDLSGNFELSLEPHVFKVILQNMTRLKELSLERVQIHSSLPKNLSSSFTIIDLSNTKVRGTFPYHIFHLPNLQQLSLGGNSFDSLVSLETIKRSTSSPLTYLDLSFCELTGTLLQYFENLTQLTHLDLFSNHLDGQIPREILGLEHLTWLDIGQNNLDVLIPHSASNGLKRLKVLSLQNNKLTTSSVSSFLRNLTQLETIDLSYNPLYKVPLDIFNLSMLQYIDLQHTQMDGPFPKSFSNLVNLRYLNLESNYFSGPIEPEALSNLVNLVYLNLASNKLNGPFEIDALSNFVKLKSLPLSSNNFDSTLDVKFLSNTKWMHTLDLSFSGLSLINESNTTLPRTSIKILFLDSCNIRNLDVLRSIIVVEQVFLSNNHIRGEIPEWVWYNWATVSILDLSNNFIAHIGSEIPLECLVWLNLESNLLQGKLPAIPHSIYTLFLSNNQFNGEIKSSICELRIITVLDLSNNSLSGAMPHCIGMVMNTLLVLDLNRNKLQGTIPDTFSLNNLKSLNLGGNQFEGKVPRSLINCSQLQILDVSENNIIDTFPIWLGNLQNLSILSLRSNQFYGHISPMQNASAYAFSQLQILDLSYNQLSGNLSTRLFQNFRRMMSVNNETRPRYFGEDYDPSVGGDSPLTRFRDSMTMGFKGNIMQLERILYAVTIIDLSSNHFDGGIPNSIGDLLAIQQLNLSHNNFTGQIIPQLGTLSKLQSLDLSSDQLVGNIPDQFGALGFLAVMNLSYNLLTGQIPSGPQLGTLQNDSYMGNYGLCGYPLSRDCGNDNSSMMHPPGFSLSDEKDYQEFFHGFTWQSVLVGYGVGICVSFVIGSLMLFNEKPKWLSQIVKVEANKIIYKYKSRNGINQTWFKKS